MTMTEQDFPNKKPRENGVPAGGDVTDESDAVKPVEKQTADSPSPVFSSSSTVSPTLQSEAARKSGNGIVITLLWFAVLLLAGAQFYLWQESKKDSNAWQMSTAQRLAQLEEAGKQQKTVEERYASGQGLMQERLAAFETRINQMQAERQTMEKMYAQVLPVRDEMVMREVENRVYLAEQQLTVTGNITAALGMLQEADNELGTLNRPDLSEVRSVLIQDMEMLQRTPVFDMHRFLAKIDQALENAATMAAYELPTVMPIVPSSEKPEDAPNWQRWWDGIKNTVLSMVRIQTSNHQQSMPKVTDIALDRQELRTRLLALRMMVLTRQPLARSESISTSAWLSDHFDLNDANVAALQSTLNDLVASPLATPLPDVSKTLAALRVWRSEQARAFATY